MTNGEKAQTEKGKDFPFSPADVRFCRTEYGG